MSVTYTHNISLQRNGQSAMEAKAVDVAAGQENNLDENVADGASALAMTFAIDVSALVSFTMISDQNLTVNTNNASGGKQVETATVAGTIGSSGAGNATVIVTAAGMPNSPVTVSVAVANNDTAAQVAGKIRTALAADGDVNSFFVVSGSSTSVILTARTLAANDATMNISIDNGTCSGLTPALTSANTQPLPGNSFTLVANKPIDWNNASGLTCPLTVDVTGLYVTNASGSSARLRIWSLQDPTP